MTAKWSHSKGIGPHRYLEGHQRPRGIHAIFEDFWPLWPSFWPLLVENRPTPLHIFRFLTPKIAILGLCRLEQSSKGCTWPSFGVGKTSITEILTKLQYFEVRCSKFPKFPLIPKIPASFRKFAKIGLLRHYKKWVFAANRAYMDLQTARIWPPSGPIARV